VGNVALKTTEGLAQMISGLIKEEFSRNWLSKLMALAAMPVLMRLRSASIIAITTAPFCWVCVVWY